VIGGNTTTNVLITVGGPTSTGDMTGAAASLSLGSNGPAVNATGVNGAFLIESAGRCRATHGRFDRVLRSLVGSPGDTSGASTSLSLGSGGP
jgi:hypothetical protein